MPRLAAKYDKDKTGLKNEEALFKNLDRLAAISTYIQVALLDVDKFKSINTFYGYKGADTKLEEEGSLIDRVAKKFGMINNN